MKGNIYTYIYVEKYRLTRSKALQIPLTFAIDKNRDTVLGNILLIPQ